MKKILKILPNVLLIMLVAYIVLMKICPEKINKFLGYQTFVILTDSMEPVLPTGSAVLVKNLKDDEEPKDGDIVSFRVDRLGEDAVFTHYYRGTETEEDGSYPISDPGSNGRTARRLYNPSPGHHRHLCFSHPLCRQDRPIPKKSICINRTRYHNDYHDNLSITLGQIRQRRAGRKRKTGDPRVPKGRENPPALMRPAGERGVRLLQGMPVPL